MLQLNPVIATAGQRDFLIPGLRAPALITINGTTIAPADFGIDGERLTLVAALGEGDEVGVIMFGN